MECLLLTLPIAVYCDLKTGKIPNKLLLPIAFGAPVQMLAGNKTQMACGAVVGMILVLLLFFPIYRLRGIGAGDLKIMMFLPGYFPKEKWEILLFLIFFCGAVMGIGKLGYGRLIKRKADMERFSGVQDGLTVFPPGKIHFSIPIWLAVSIALMK